MAPIKLDDVLLISQNGYALRFNIEEVPVVGAKAAGVKAMNLKADDVLQSAFICNTSSFYLLTQRGSLKRVSIDEIPATSHAKRGLQVLRELKINRIVSSWQEQLQNKASLVTSLVQKWKRTTKLYLFNPTKVQSMKADCKT